MEVANLGLGVIRQANGADSRAIYELLQSAYLRHSHVDWRTPADWLGTPGFVVSEVAGRSRPFAPAAPRLQACLAVGADPLPAAWLRAVAVRQVDHPERLLRAMLEQVLPYLRSLGACELACLASDSWPDQFLPDLGFHCRHRIISLLKDDLDIPDAPLAPVVVRPVAGADLAELAAIEEAAFEPRWRHSVAGLALGWRQAASFDVAMLDGRVVGFQYSARSATGSAAHLVRMTVRPEFQGQGVGRALLTTALRGYRERGHRSVSLNTQAENTPSQRLYQGFGFHPVGDELPVWVLPLA